VYHVLVREYHPDTWQLGKITEVQFPKKKKTGVFSQYIHEKLFSHIPTMTFMGVKAGFMKTFYRSKLAQGGWKNMKACDKDKYLGESFLEVSRDSTVIVVKNSQTPQRAELTSAEIEKGYADESYLRHLDKRSKNMD
jgi:hypothetical protein